MSSRDCVISLNNFCFICGEYAAKFQYRKVTDLVKRVYFAYFKLKIEDQDKPGHFTRHVGDMKKTYLNGSG